MFYLGCHLSSSEGYLHMGETARSIEANTFQFFTRNPRGGTAKPLNLEDIAAYNAYAKTHAIGTIVAHAPYTMNLCSDKSHIREFARSMMRDDLERLQHVDNVVYNFHPGSHVGQGVDLGIRMIIEAINEVLTKEITTPILLETMAGKGSEIGRSFEEIKTIIDGVHFQDKIGVCMDSCHVYDAGYDVVTKLNEVIDSFDDIVGIDRLQAFHLNDSKNDFGSGKDRHAKIGEGSLGLQTIVNIINHPKLKDLPFNLETPNELDGYAQEIKLLRDKRL
ncbi:MAG: deoxyribonuclease IV [Clostridiaceae bacterium]|nr:deoxyribonuclease IV [Clostridiales bacterium]MDY0119134.1 deoxyribonuclease IV [Clostridia bacterium]NLG30254.1 deoxyribonuclease IV [Clostridiaceae bacterium]